jgi:hypothetical protein
VRELSFACVEVFARVVQTTVEYSSVAELKLRAMNFTNAKSLAQLLLRQPMLGVDIEELRKRFLLPEETAVSTPLAEELEIPLVTEVRAECGAKLSVRCQGGLPGSLTVELSGARADDWTWHFIYHASAPAIC